MWLSARRWLPIQIQSRARLGQLTRCLSTLAVVTAFFMSSSLPAGAHGRSVSYSSWEIDGNQAVVSFRLKLLELSRLGADALPPLSQSGDERVNGQDHSSGRFPSDLVLIADGTPCRSEPTAEQRPDATGWVRYQWRIECPTEARSLSIHSRVLLSVAPSHMHFARVRFASEHDQVREKILTEASPVFNIRSAEKGAGASEIGSPLFDYIKLGVEHILSGWDHLAFVFGLLLLATRFSEVARLITGFTIAHSLTLALAVQGLVHPRAAAVEAVIAFSVALVAIEKGWLHAGRHPALPIVVLAALGVFGVAAFVGATGIPLLTIVGLFLFTSCYFALSAKSESPWLRVCLTFAFGLVHGFGFAGVLVEMTLPTERLIPALLGFNLGVELGQIGVVLLIWPILVLSARFASNSVSRLSSAASAAALCGLGVYWLVERAFSP